MAIIFNVDKGFAQIDASGDGELDNAGETITYTLEVTNNSTAGEQFDELYLTDDLLGLLDYDLIQAVNDGHLTLSGDDGDFVLEPGETWLFQEAVSSDVFTYSVTQEDLDSNGTVEPGDVNEGFIDNLASVEGVRVAGGTFSASGSAGVEVVQDPSIDIEKATNGQDADSPTGPEIVVGGAVNWTYEVTNDGNLTLTDVVVTDDNGTPGDTGDDFSPTAVESGGFNVGDTDQDGALDPGETWLYEASSTAESGQYANIADVDALGPQDQAVSDSDPSHYNGVNVDIDIEKATNGQDADSPTGPNILVGDTATFTYLVTNPGDVALSNVVVTDDNGTPGDTGDDFSPTAVESGGFNVGDTDQDGLLDPGETWEYTADRTVTEGQYTNESSVSGDYEQTTVTDDDPSNHFGVDPQIDIEKATNGEDADSPTGPVIPVGDTATFTYVVTNAGNVEIDNVVVTDDNGTPGDTGDDFNPTAVESGGFNVGDTDQDGLLDPGESWEYTADRTVTEGQYTNVSTVTGSDIVLDSPVSDSDPSNHFGADPQIDIEKATNGQDADSPTGPNILVGDTATFTYLVTNPGNVEIENVVVTDDNGTPGDTGDDFSPTAVESGGFNVGDTDQDGLLDPGESWEYTADRTVTEGQYTNESSVSGEFGETTVTDDDPSNHFGVDPQIDIEKATNGEDADSPTGPVIPVGGTATFTYVVTNAGNVEIDNVVVTDDNGTPGDTGDDFNPTAVESGGFNVGDTDQDGLLDPGESWEYTADRTVTEGQYTNVSTVTGSDIVLDSPVSDSDPSNHFGEAPSEPGSANTPGFWKNHLDIFECETGYDRDEEYEVVFGLPDGAVDADLAANGRNIKVPQDPTLEEALEAKGGGQAALLRASTAGMANALSDDTSYTYTDDDTMADGIYEVFGLMPGDPGYDDVLASVRDVLDEVDLNDNGAIEFNELQSAVQDAFADEEYNELAQALDVMNNQPSVEVEDFLGCYTEPNADAGGPPPWAASYQGPEDADLYVI
ncbi:hypothetical protein DDZ18_03135 [Marinicauda salina]|uniref:EF-hand domain-containing protein n=1 Tax=Marinicauda salina TaxID=2135793 RepID=A0A2U2BX76_9PROT|nr:DUF11 domain-containing protein [Marinicauda salina]PWE18612.1 hypothetical protein DDZ18_03135 [Marinicauda salina]